MFLGARAPGIGTVTLEALTLYRNFRSAPQVVQWNNAVFARCFPQLDDPRTSAVAYAPSIAARARRSTPAPCTCTACCRATCRGEAAGIARVVAASARHAAGGEHRHSAERARARRHPSSPHLPAAQIAVAGVDLVSLQQLSIVRDLTALTQAMDHLADRTAWLAILRAPWCGLAPRGRSARSPARIGVRRCGSDSCDPQVRLHWRAGADLRLRRLRAALAISFEERSRPMPMAVKPWRGAWSRRGCAWAVRRRVRRSADLAHARAFFDALAQWCAGAGLERTAGAAAATGTAVRDHQPAPAQAVQIMTIHHAKGLEFDHVILPGLGRQRRGHDRELLQWLDLPRGTSGSDLLMVAVPPAAASGPTALGRYVTRLQNQREAQRGDAAAVCGRDPGALATASVRTARGGNGARNPILRRAPARCCSGCGPRSGNSFRASAEACGTTAMPQSMAAVPAVVTLERLRADWRLPPLPPVRTRVVLPIAGLRGGAGAVPRASWSRPCAKCCAAAPAGAPCRGARRAALAPLVTRACSGWAARRRCCRSMSSRQWSCWRHAWRTHGCSGYSQASLRPRLTPKCHWP